MPFWAWMSWTRTTSSPLPAPASCRSSCPSPFAVAENFTGLKGKYVPLQDTVRGFAAIVDGEADDLPEWAFFNVGTLEDARQKAAEKLAEEKGGAI